MPSYGFTIDTNENVVATMARIEKAVASMSAKVESLSKKTEQTLNHLGDAAKEVAMKIGEAFAVRELVHYGQELLHLTAEFEGFENVIKYSSINSYDAGQNLAFLGDEIKKMHLPIKETYEAFSQMQAGFYGTGIEGERLRKVFDGLATANAVLHMSPVRFQMMTFALKEIGELGTLQARQFRMLAQDLPGTPELAARAMKMTTEQLHQAMKKGAISAGEFIPAFADELQKHFGAGLANANGSLIAAMNDTKTAFIQKALELGEALRPVFMNIMQTIRNVFDSAPIKLFIEHAKPIIEMLLTGAKLWLEYKSAIVLAELAMGAYGVIAKAVEVTMAGLTLGIEGVEVALAGMEGIFATTGIGAFGILVGYLVEQFLDLQKSVDDADEAITHFKEAQGGADAFSKDYNRVVEAYKNKGGHTEEERSMNLKEMGQLVDRITKHMGETDDKLLAAQADDAEYWKKHRRNPTTIKQESGVTEQIGGLKALKAADLDKLLNLKEYMADLQRGGTKVYKQGAVPHHEGTNLKESALKTVGLAGAKGGLGEAKIINIKIDTMQRVSVGTPAGLKAAGQDAIEVLVRALNNLAYGQSRTM